MASNVDTSQVEAGLQRWGYAVREALAEGLGRGGAQLLNDAVQEIPTVPLESGYLRGSGSVFVNGKLVTTSPQGVAGGSPAISDDDPARGRAEVICRVGFNTVYAAVQHEGRWETGPLAGVEIAHYTEPGSGRYYLLTPLQSHGEEYIQTAIDYTRRALGM